MTIRPISGCSRSPRCATSPRSRPRAATVRYPRLELMGLEALSAMREALAKFDAKKRPAANRIVLYVRPPWDVPRDAWPELARSLAPLAVGAGLEKVVLRVRFPDGRDRVLDLEGLGGGVTVRERPLGSEPIRPLTPYQQKLLRANRFGVPYPYEIVRMLTPPAEAVARFPPGSSSSTTSTSTANSSRSSGRTGRTPPTSSSACCATTPRRSPKG